jgi:hypothetical protein
VRKGKQITNENQANAKNNLEDQAWEIKFPGGKIGKSVRLRVAVADRARSDPRNAIAVTTQCTIWPVYREELWHNLSPEPVSRLHWMSEEEEVPGSEISLWECDRKLSLSGG